MDTRAASKTNGGAWTRPDAVACAALAVVAIAARLPLVSRLGLVTFDGTFYLNEARALLAGHKLPGTFPIGYPVAAALFHAVVRDWVRAGQMVSFAAAVVSTLLVYALARRVAGRAAAVVAALLLTLNPLFLRLSVQTLSESLYIALVLGGILMVLRGNLLRAGLCLGAAAATRPEGLAIIGVVAAMQLRRPRRLVSVVAAGAVVFGIGAGVMSWSQGRVVLLPKASWFGSSGENWKANERTIDFEGPASWKEAPEADAETAAPRGVVSEYLHSMPAELAALARFTYPAVLLLALVGIARLRWHVFLAPLASLLFFTLFTKRHEDRYLLPYVPFLILYAVAGVQWLRGARATLWRAVALVALGACAAALLFAERTRMVLPEDVGVGVMKQAGLYLRDQVEPGDRVADRKPYTAFYAGGRYVEIPVAPYEDTMRFLAKNVEWLALHRDNIHRLRPALRPLMYSKAVINGELRFDEVYAADTDAAGGGELVFRRARESDPLQWTQLTEAAVADNMPAWSPDGTRIAVWSQRDDGRADLVVLARGNRALPWSRDNVERRTVATGDDSREPLAWSPDGGRIAFTVHPAGRDDADIVAVDVYSGDVTTLVGGTTDDHAPSWSRSNELAFVSNRDGGDDVWVRDLGTGRTTQITRDGGYAFPVFSPDGGRIACTRGGLAIVRRDDGSALRFPSPRRIAYAPAWSPDGSLVAVTSDDWGSWDIYMMKADATNALLLTKNATREGMPAWSPDGSQMAFLSDRTGTFSVWLLDGLETYRRRLDERVRMDTLPQEAQP